MRFFATQKQHLIARRFKQPAAFLKRRGINEVFRIAKTAFRSALPPVETIKLRGTFSSISGVLGSPNQPVSGFSQITWQPAASAVLIIDTCRFGGVQMSTRSPLMIEHLFQVV
jgi:hypothetical protein